MEGMGRAPIQMGQGRLGLPIACLPIGSSAAEAWIVKVHTSAMELQRADNN